MIEWTIPNMTCGHCVATVKRTLQQQDPQAAVEVDLPSHRVRVESALDPEQLRRALAEEGYEAQAA